MRTGRLNKMSVAAIMFAVIAATDILGVRRRGPSVFAVGAGHVALNQIPLRGGRGRGLAIAALAIGYGITTLVLIDPLGSILSVLQQFSRQFPRVTGLVQPRRYFFGPGLRTVPIEDSSIGNDGLLPRIALVGMTAPVVVRG